MTDLAKESTVRCEIPVLLVTIMKHNATAQADKKRRIYEPPLGTNVGEEKSREYEPKRRRIESEESDTLILSSLSEQYRESVRTLSAACGVLRVVFPQHLTLQFWFGAAYGGEGSPSYKIRERNHHYPRQVPEKCGAGN